MAAITLRDALIRASCSPPAYALAEGGESTCNVADATLPENLSRENREKVVRNARAGALRHAEAQRGPTPQA